VKPLNEWIEEMIEKVKGSRQASALPKKYAAGYLTGLRQVLHELKFREDAEEKEKQGEDLTRKS